MKQCNNCKITKKLSEYYRNVNLRDGAMSECKDCRNKKYVIRSRTKDGVVSRIYSDQRKSSLKRNHTYPPYSNLELRAWIFNQPIFHKLYDEWIASGYKKMMKPSCDRYSKIELNYNELPYSLDRLRVVTWKENADSRTNDFRSGLLKTKDKPQKEVNQYTLDEKFINEFVSGSEAARQLNIHQSNISACCRGKKKQTNGYKFCFKNEKNNEELS